MNDRSKLIACYVRVSTVGQNEEGQRAEIERWLEGNGIDPAAVAWYVDKKSGDSLDRPAFEELQKAIFVGSIGTVVVYKLDRISRKLVEGINVLADWWDKGLRVVSVTNYIDATGTVGTMIAAVLLGVAQMEQEHRRERQAAGIAEAKKKKGKYKGRKKGTTKAKPKRAVAMRERGFSPPEIALALGVSRNTVYRYFREAKS